MAAKLTDEPGPIAEIKSGQEFVHFRKQLYHVADGGDIAGLYNSRAGKYTEVNG